MDQTCADTVIRLRTLHEMIQQDAAKQYTIYQEAMNLWR
jgi:predicted DNA-binding protein (UPF0251 family)